ncbi:DUF3006 domain-containing protein [Natrialba asiatica]|uniref:DUF3006 family protein n=1 Tax=Natrialba asiatica (strain ATCC 700177 / DSM 12278 / JCM 9576 / FERM P-10747 / NBRC 102637 / 172P1) TaxID=29540 RepID=M0AYC8_NATA1|nr:DUF3006 family protein [Natrialba asiatica]ELZ03490.1 hypothetical protein C481_05835 [Natrialba asiatica DSM 12278]
MSSRATYTAVLDRVVDGETAVLLLEDGGDPVAEVTLPLDRVPAAGQHDGAVFEVTVDETTGGETTDEVNSVLDLEYREDEENARREQTQDRFDRLSERLSEE